MGDLLLYRDTMPNGKLIFVQLELNYCSTIEQRHLKLIRPSESHYLSDLQLERVWDNLGNVLEKH